MKSLRINLLCFFTGLTMTVSFGQNNVGIGTTTPSPDAVLEMESTDQGVLVPRMTTAQRNAILNPSEGLMVYDTQEDCFFFFESTSSSWRNLCKPQKYHVYGTSGRSGVIDDGAPPAVQPGMSQTFTLSSPATVMIWATIGALTTTSTSGSYAIVDMIIYANGNFLPNGGWNRFSVVNPTNMNAIGNSAINTMISLPAGTHTIELRTQVSGGDSPVDIGGDSSLEVNPGEMTILVLD